MTQRKRIIFLLPFLFVFFSAFSSLSAPVPTLKGRVVDNGSMLSAATTVQIENILATLEAEDSTQIVVLTINSLQGDNLEEYALKVAETWKIGQKGIDNGALLLIAKNDRKIRIEVGYGLEGSLTDLITGRIIRDIITPKFKSGNFDQGVLNGVLAMTSAVKGEFNISEITTTSESADDKVGVFFFILFFFLPLGRIFRKNNWLGALVGSVLAPLLAFFFFGANWILLLIFIPIGLVAGFVLSALNLNSSSGRSSGWSRSSRSSGGFGGGFSSGGGGFSGGGGGFGGGGSSGGW